MHFAQLGYLYFFLIKEDPSANLHIGSGFCLSDLLCYYIGSLNNSKALKVHSLE